MNSFKVFRSWWGMMDIIDNTVAILCILIIIYLANTDVVIRILIIQPLN